MFRSLRIGVDNGDRQDVAVLYSLPLFGYRYNAVVLPIVRNGVSVELGLVLKGLKSGHSAVLRYVYKILGLVKNVIYRSLGLTEDIVARLEVFEYDHSVAGGGNGHTHFRSVIRYALEGKGRTCKALAGYGVEFPQSQ